MAAEVGSYLKKEGAHVVTTEIMRFLKKQEGTHRSGVIRRNGGRLSDQTVALWAMGSDQ